MLQLCTATTCHCGTNFAERILLANEAGLMHKRASFRTVMKARCGLLRRALFLACEVRRLLCRRSCALEIGLVRGVQSSLTFSANEANFRKRSQLPQTKPTAKP